MFYVTGIKAQIGNLPKMAHRPGAANTIDH